MTYARSRLNLGLFTTILWAFLCSGILVFEYHTQIISKQNSIYTLVLFWLLYLIINTPIDLWGGYFLPKKHGKHGLSFSSFSLLWLKSSFLFSLISFVIGFTIVWLTQHLSIGYVLLAPILFITAGMFLQWPLAKLLGKFNTECSSNVSCALKLYGLPQLAIKCIKSYDYGFTGGWNGFGKSKTLLIPVFWKQQLSEYALCGQVSRRVGAIETGSRARGLAIAFAWHILGLVMAFLLFGSPVTYGIMLLYISFVTLFTYVGKVFLIALSRKSIFELDRFALDEGFSIDELKETIELIDFMQDDEICRSNYLEMFIHPLPCVNNRIYNMYSNIKPEKGAWLVTRNLLYFSFLTGTGVATRTMHSNIGRPNLWIMQNTD